jgi:hypothetical protein
MPSRIQYVPQQQFRQKPARLTINAGHLAFTRSGDVQGRNLTLREPMSHRQCAWSLGKLDFQTRLTGPPGELIRQFRAATKFVSIEYQRGVGGVYVLFRTDVIVLGFGLDEQILCWNAPILGAPSARTVSAMLDTKLQRKIERRAIDAGLSAGNNPAHLTPRQKWEGGLFHRYFVVTNGPNSKTDYLHRGA